MTEPTPAGAMPDRLAQKSLEARAVQLQQLAAASSEGDERRALLRKAAKLKDAARIADVWEASPRLKSLS